MESEDHNERQALLGFLDGLPESVGRLRVEDARWFMRMLSMPGAERTFELLQTTKWAERLGSTGFCPPGEFTARLVEALGITFNLVDVSQVMDMQDPELVRWVKIFCVQRPGQESGTSGPQFRYTRTGCSPTSSCSHIQVASREVDVIEAMDGAFSTGSKPAGVCSNKSLHRTYIMFIVRIPGESCWRVFPYLCK